MPTEEKILETKPKNGDEAKTITNEIVQDLLITLKTKPINTNPKEKGLEKNY